MKNTDEIAKNINAATSSALSDVMWELDDDGTKADKAPTFMGQCMHHQIAESGKDPKQAIAICMSLKQKWGDTVADWDKYMASQAKKP